MRAIGRILVIGLCLAGVARDVRAADPSAESLLDLYLEDARAYRMFRDAAHSDQLTLVEKPVFSWVNNIRETKQVGHLFVWTKDERPEVIGTIFSNPAREAAGRRTIVHEFHTLSPDQLHPVTPDNCLHQWNPERGVSIQPVENGGEVGSTAPQRLLQMRAVARRFVAETHDQEKQVWQLRLLTTPVIRYQPKSGPVHDGALFAMVTSAGTDPELFILVEARQPSGDNTKWEWNAAALRFTDRDLVVKLDDKPLWSSLEDESRRVSINNGYTLIKTPDQTYCCYRSRMIPELPDAAK
jgi:hypothetical protein